MYKQYYGQEENTAIQKNSVHHSAEVKIAFEFNKLGVAFISKLKLNKHFEKRNTEG